METNRSGGGAESTADAAEAAESVPDEAVVRALLAASGLTPDPADLASIVTRVPLVRRNAGLLHAVDLPLEALPAVTFAPRSADRG